MNPGFLIALEGVDGSGKSTAAAGIARGLRSDGHEVVETREPTDGPYGRRIREMARSGETVAPEEELRWFLEDRSEHVRKVIQPAVDEGKVVITDRYFLSTVAYQGARGLDWHALLEEAEARFPIPELALIFEIDPLAGLARTAARGGVAEPAFEEATFLSRVAAVYEAIDRPWVARIDASAAPDEVVEASLAVIRERCPN